MNRVILAWLFGQFLFGLFPSAKAGESDVKPTQTIIVDEEVWPHFNWASYDQDKIVSHGHYQYSIYWDVDKVLVVIRRDLRDNKVEALRLTQHKLTINPRDGHRNTVIGISPEDGRLHLSWDHHNNDLRYTKTRKNFLTEPPEAITKEDFEDAQQLAPGAPQRVTYPRFLNDSKGTLYFMYRSGGSGNGRTIVSRYDSEESKWHVSAGCLFGSRGRYQPWNNSGSRNAYLHDVLFDKNDRLHVTWVYREAARTWASNHDLHYAYSDDSGTTWMNNRGKKIADLSKNDAIVITDPGIVVQDIPVYSWLMNQCAMALDSRNQPHVALYKLPKTFKPERLKHGPPSDVRKQLRVFHYWRHPDGSWHSSGPLELPEGMSIRRPNIVIDKENRVIIYWSSNQGFRCYIASADDQWQGWKVLKLTGPQFTTKGTCKHDRRLLRNKGILSFTADPNGTTANHGYAILDFDIEDLSTAAQDSGDGK